MLGNLVEVPQFKLAPFAHPVPHAAEDAVLVEHVVFDEPAEPREQFIEAGNVKLPVINGWVL